MAEKSSKEYARRWQGRPLDLLVEEKVQFNGKTYLRGHSANYLTLLLPDDGADTPLRRVVITDRTAEGLTVREV